MTGDDWYPIFVFIEVSAIIGIIICLISILILTIEDLIDRYGHKDKNDPHINVPWDNKNN